MALSVGAQNVGESCFYYVCLHANPIRRNSNSYFPLALQMLLVQFAVAKLKGLFLFYSFNIIAILVVWRKILAS